jgi:hypothetical protein
MACVARIYWDFDDGSRFTVEEIECMLDVVTVNDVKFFTLSPSSKLLTDVVGSCNAVTAKPHATRARQVTSQYSVVRRNLVNSSFINEARELRNAASVAHSLSLLSDMRQLQPLPHRSQAAVNALRHNREIIHMTLPAVGEEPSITTRILKMVKKNDPIQIEFSAETVSRIIMLIRDKGTLELRSARSPNRPRGIRKISGGRYKGLLGDKWIHGATVDEVQAKIANNGQSAASDSAPPTLSPRMRDASVDDQGGSESGYGADGL